MKNINEVGIFKNLAHRIFPSLKLNLLIGWEK